VNLDDLHWRNFEDFLGRDFEDFMRGNLDYLLRHQGSHFSWPDFARRNLGFKTRSHFVDIFVPRLGLLVWVTTLPIQKQETGSADNQDPCRQISHHYILSLPG